MYSRSPLTARLLVLTALMLCFGMPIVAQDDPVPADEIPALSLQRLSVGITSTFFYAPWKDLNDSFGAVRDAYAYNPTLGLQNGSVDRHRGDLSTGIDLTYRIVGPISLLLEGHRTFTDANMGLRTVPTGYFLVGSPSYPTTFDYSLDLQVTGLGGGFVIDLLGSPRTRVRLSAGRATAALDYAFSAVSDREITRLNASLSDESTYITVGLEGSIPIVGSLSFNLGATYRSLRFARLEGDGTLFHDWPDYPGYAETIPFSTGWVKAGSYYGIDPAEGSRVYIGDRALVVPWLGTPGTSVDELTGTTTRTTLYLNGFGVRGGLSYAF